MILSFPQQAGDAATRERIRHSLGESLIVEASAGTGKTSELIRRIVRVLATGAVRVEKVVAVTFTHKAAGEMKIRLRQGLDQERAAASDPAERDNLEDALARLEEASIGTIHGFCTQILRERPVEAGIDPEFAELTDQEASRLYDRAFDIWFRRKLSEGSPVIRRALARLAWRDAWDSAPPVEQLKFAGRNLIEWRDFPASWRREPLNRDGAVDLLVDRILGIADVAARCPKSNDPLVTGLRPTADLVTWIERTESSGQRDYDALEGRLLKLGRDLRKFSKKGSGFFADGVPRVQVVQARENLMGALEDFQRRCSADLASLLRDELGDLVKTYEELKSRAGRLDFLDLLLRVRDLVRGNRDVRRYLQRRFDRIFVDEFQDTDPLQAEILVLLSADNPEEEDWRQVTPIPGKLFVVGDPKQSIYKFRRADVVLYESICESLRSRGVGRVALTRSFRSVRPIQEFVNAAFAPEMTGDRESGQAAYAPLEEFRPPFESQPAIIALPAPKPYGQSRVSKEAINECLPDAVAAFVAWLVGESGWQVSDPRDPAHRIPVEARHVCILFRRFLNRGVDITREYVRSLESRGVPQLLAGSKSFHHREEVETLRAALAAVEWPDDELSVFAVLRGSLFAVPDDLLLRFRGQMGPLFPLRPLPGGLAPEFQPIREALERLAELHRQRNRRPIADTINRLLETTRAHAGFALRPSGPQAVANVYRLCDSARSFESSGGVSFRGFVEELNRQAERAEAPEAPVLEEASDGVRLMTVHTAKGLEFPVVILADMTANLTASDPDRHVDASQGLCATRLLRCSPWELIEHDAVERAREKAEGVRVAYVAATRARDLLVVTAVGDEPREGWLQPLNKSLFPARPAWRRRRRAPGCPEFGTRTVVARPPDYAHEEEFSVMPGQHAAESGGHSVVWWDPEILKLNVAENFGLRQEDILAPQPEDRAAEGVRRYRDWKVERERVLTAGRTPEFVIFSPSEAPEDPPVVFPIGVESLPFTGSRPSGRRYGTLVHAVLRDAGWNADAGRIEKLAKAHGRLFDATEPEVASASRTVLAALSHPLMDKAKRSDRCHRELPLILRLDDGRLLEGVVDLAFLENETWIVVDFKSDVFLGASQQSYERQLRWYAYALSRITGRAAEGRLLRL